MKKTFFYSFKILLFSFLLPFKIWKATKSKIQKNLKTGKIDTLLDEDYIATSWLDLAVDAFIFLIYPIGIILSIFIAIMGYQKDEKMLFLGILSFLPLYLSPLIISFARELGSSFMLLHMNIKRIRK